METNEKESETTPSVSDACVVVEQVERDHNVTVLLASDYGSHAWGLSRKGSDRDIGGIYMRNSPLRYYMDIFLDNKADTIHAKADGIHLQLWDIRKALQLMKKSNVRLLELFNSTVIYRSPATSVILMMQIAHSVYSLRTCYLSYMGTARSAHKSMRDSPKDLWKVLRPLIMARSIHRHKTALCLDVETNLLHLPNYLQDAVKPLYDHYRYGAPIDDSAYPVLYWICDDLLSRLEKAPIECPPPVVTNEQAELMLNQIFMSQMGELESPWEC